MGDASGRTMGVHCAKAGGREGHEQARVLGHRLRHPLAAAQTGRDYVEGIAPGIRRRTTDSGFPFGCRRRLAESGPAR